MSNRVRALREIALLCALFAAGCGGGGDGGAGGGSGSGNNGSLTMSFASTTVDLEAFGPAFNRPINYPLFAKVSGTGSGTLYVIVTTSNPQVATVANIFVASNGGTADIVPGSPTVLGVGTHTATITVKACLNSPSCTSNQIKGSPANLTVNYVVRGTMSNVSQLSFSIGNSAVASDYTKPFQIDMNPASGWTVTQDIPFLSVTPATVTSGLRNNVNASITPALLDEYEGGSWSGTLRFQPNTVYAGLEIPVAVNITRTRVNHVSPYLAEPGHAADVVIRGENFNAAPPTGVRFGTFAATSFTVVSNTEIHATHPALAVGRYPVHVDNAQGIDRTTAELVVVDPVAFPVGTIDFPDGPEVLVYAAVFDAERSALLVEYVYNQVGTETNRLARFAYGPGGWQLTGSTLVNYASIFALSADGRKIILGRAGYDFRDGAIEELDPVTLAVTRHVDVPGFGGGQGVAVANDGRVILHEDSPTIAGPGYAAIYSPLRRSYQPLRTTDTPPSVFELGAMVASGDGSLILVSDDRYERTLRYDSNTVNAPQVLAYRPFRYGGITNRDGSLFVTGDNKVLDATFEFIGNLPANLGVKVLEPAGTRIFTYDTNTEKLRVFDTSIPKNGNQIGEILPASSPAAGNLGYVYSLQISRDGGTLFIFGRAKIGVQPLP